jgi:hypothetical protein
MRGATGRGVRLITRPVPAVPVVAAGRESLFPWQVRASLPSTQCVGFGLSWQFHGYQRWCSVTARMG